MKAKLTLSTLSRLQRQQDNTFPFNFCYYSNTIHGTINAADFKLLKLLSLPKVKPKTFSEGSFKSSIHKKVTKETVLLHCCLGFVNRKHAPEQQQNPHNFRGCQE